MHRIRQVTLPFPRSLSGGSGDTLHSCRAASAMARISAFTTWGRLIHPARRSHPSIASGRVLAYRSTMAIDLCPSNSLIRSRGTPRSWSRVPKVCRQQVQVEVVEVGPLAQCLERLVAGILVDIS